jgi:hypothetical protein
MTLLKDTITLLIGAHTPRPVPAALSEALDSLEVTYRDRSRSGFQLTFRVGRVRPSDLQDDPFLRGELEKLLLPFNRVIVTVGLNSRPPRVLLDGIITYQEFTPSTEPGDSTLTIMGEDVSVMMDLEEKSVEHLELDDQSIVESLIGSYAKYGLTPKLSKPQWTERPLKTERVPVQLGTDLDYIRELADRHGFVFYLMPGPGTGSNVAYWGPPDRKATPSPPLTVNMGSWTNVESINFQYDALAVVKVKGQVQDRKSNQIQPVSSESSRRASLAAEPALTTQTRTRTVQFRQTARLQNQADAYTQAMVDRATDGVITARGELDSRTYGDLLQHGGTVDLRGAGHTYDGRYYVNEVTHTINGEGHKQRFTLTREGTGSTISSVTV